MTFLCATASLVTYTARFGVHFTCALTNEHTKSLFNLYTSATRLITSAPMKHHTKMLYTSHSQQCKRSLIPRPHGLLCGLGMRPLQ